jgi:tetratricopeptide (TPR) repeat protein
MTGVAVRPVVHNLRAMYYPGWLAAYLLASVLSGVLGIPYPIAFVLILASWLLRDRLRLPPLGRLLGGASALKEAQREAAVNPANAEAQSQAGLLLVERGRYEQALPYLRAALQRMSGSAEVNALLGSALLNTEGPEAALPYLRRAIEIDPRFRQGEAHLRLAEALERAGDPAEAHDLLMDFFGESTANVEALHRMGTAAAAAGHPDEARRCFLAAKEAYRTNPPFRRGRDRRWVMKARRALGEKLVADRLTLTVILAAGTLYYLWRLLR